VPSHQISDGECVLQERKDDDRRNLQRDEAGQGCAHQGLDQGRPA